MKGTTAGYGTTHVDEYPSDTFEKFQQSEVLRHAKVKPNVVDGIYLSMCVYIFIYVFIYVYVCLSVFVCIYLFAILI